MPWKLNISLVTLNLETTALWRKLVFQVPKVNSQASCGSVPGSDFGTHSSTTSMEQAHKSGSSSGSNCSSMDQKHSRAYVQEEADEPRHDSAIAGSFDQNFGALLGDLQP